MIDENRNKKIVTVLLGILILLFLNLGYNVWHLYSYQIQRESGNEKWKQVEERIHEIETKVDNFYKDYNK